MKQDSLNQFTRQLACWAEEYLQRSRSPMRRIDIAPTIATACGPLCPDLVIWINRDSCMAGGILLVPPRQAEEVEARGRDCALALGLRHFVVWGTREIVFWEILEQGLACHKTLPAPAAGEDAAGFRRALATLLDELKYLTVAGAVAPEKLPPHYLVNLCQGAIEDTLGGLTELMRIARSEGRQGSGGAAPEGLALDKALLTLVRLAALLHLDQLPPSVQPEGLERAMVFALDTLPQKLRQPLLPAAGELPLPLEAAVRFHHLLRRLTQLGGCRDRQRLAHLVSLLLGLHGPALGLSDQELPATEPGELRLLVNTGRLSAGEADWEVAPASVLVMFCLLRFLRKLPAALAHAPNPFQLPGNPRPQRIIGALTAAASVPARERVALQARLRISWPTRRFNLPVDLPRWGWELLHLIGLAEPGARLQLRTPDNWLVTPVADGLLELVRLECTPIEIGLGTDDNLRLELVKSRDEEPALSIVRPAGKRTLDPGLWGTAPAGILALAVTLPDPLWSLLDSQLLLLQAAGELPGECVAGVILFAQSSVGRALWQILGQGQALPRRERLAAAFAERHMPLPRMDILSHLARFGAENSASLPGQASIDAALAPWFGSEFATGMAPSPARHPGPAVPPPIDAGAARSTLRQEIFQDGLPLFPDHYLFAHFRPTLEHYRFTPPLVRAGEFFGQITLNDVNGQRLTAPSPAMAQALELVAAMGRTDVGLPSDPVIMEDILNRYLRDLQTFHGELLRRTHAMVPDPRQAQRLARDLWRELELPPPALFLAR